MEKQMGKLNRLASDKIKGLRRSRTRTLRRENGGRETAARSRRLRIRASNARN